MRTERILWVLLLAALAAALPDLAVAQEALTQPTRADYPTVGALSSRTIVWGLAQMHLFLAAFVLAVPFFVLCIELAGVVSRDDRYDDMAHEFMKISMAAYSFTALAGGGLTLALFLFYPNLMEYLLKVFRGQTLIYAVLFFMESAFLYIYYYSWDALRYGDRKWYHMSLGLVLNAVGMTLMLRYRTAVPLSRRRFWDFLRPV